jgi:hypothetical protein
VALLVFLYTVAPEPFDESAIEFYVELTTCLTQALVALCGDLAGGLAYDVTASVRSRSGNVLRRRCARRGLISRASRK